MIFKITLRKIDAKGLIDDFLPKVEGVFEICQRYPFLKKISGLVSEIFEFVKPQKFSSFSKLINFEYLNLLTSSNNSFF